MSDRIIGDDRIARVIFLFCSYGQRAEYKEFLGAVLRDVVVDLLNIY